MEKQQQKSNRWEESEKVYPSWFLLIVLAVYF